MRSDRDYFAAALERFSLSESQVDALVGHYQVLAAWNARMNLTRVIEREAACRKHFEESLAIAAFIPPGAVIADIGSGGGFPGIPLAIARPDLQVHLVESVGKKASFLREATRGFANTAVHGLRAEDLRRRFDLIVSRAVTPAFVASLVPELAERAIMLMAESDTGSTWNTLKRLRGGVVAEFHVKPNRESDTFE